MAEIHIEKKRGAGWLWWLVALIILALLIWWLTSMNDDDNVAEAPGVVAPAAVADGTARPELTDVDAIVLVPVRESLVGERVALVDAPVQDVVSDRGFWLGRADSARVFAILKNEVPTPNTPVEGRWNVEPGQRLTVFGVIERMPANLEEQRSSWNLGSLDLTALQKERIYIAVDSLRILER